MSNKTFKALNIPNHNILPLVKFIEAENLFGRASRNRTKFILLMVPRLKELEEERMNICKKFSETKKVKGEDVVVYIDKDGKDTTNSEGSSFKIKDVNGFNKEYTSIMSENLIIDVLPSTEEMIKDVTETVLNTKTSFSGLDANIYNSFCEIFEGIK